MVKVLRHEVMDWLVSEAIAPYRDLMNTVIKTLNEEAYRRKKKAVEALTRLLEGE